ncbi:oxygen-independent coproporphyrinogen III oxidase [Sulfitobacter sabulilitoris]|uniref:Coproporphyrinogen-III oxidase n=1 Tax=Sulfitobacter sabulilitoris TaxID=2562655 RepID=A0A5S3PD28_9RHOB|nr:oxygen-independent coproporphyrinogen III oxidase [Sulfitobacter sabulilitoris]TMM51773.1 oxygen-independent coproporphyrinogen III oxidase [Sulfitobacter sabulilitoris]
MMSYDALNARGLFDTGLPRYTSYPTAPVFSPAVGASFQASELQALDPVDPVSVYVHLPFCERLCWFCACRTQGVQSLAPVERYLDTLERELDQIKALTPKGLTMGRLHWGGGTPTILPPQMIDRLIGLIDRVFARSDRFEFSVEIDPTLVSAAKIVALRTAGMTRASIGVQDFDDMVQDAIGRRQSFGQTRACVDLLRQAGIGSVNVDLVYGLPYQTRARFRRTLELVDTLGADRVALFGYAHVPHMAKRQVLIPVDVLPGDRARHALNTMAADHFTAAGMQKIGIDHFARRHDDLSLAARTGRLRRNFQGYTTDDCPTLIGIGASAMSSFRGGHVQNAPQTNAYVKRIEAGTLAGCRGHRLSAEDRLRGEVIEMLMCRFKIDTVQLQLRHDDLSAIAPALELVQNLFGDVLDVGATTLTLRPEAHALVRLIASLFDAYPLGDVQYSRAS